MANTTNYNWETPDDTDLVKDGAAAIRTLGNSIDTTTKNLNPQTTTGDIAYRSATANVNTRLALGTAGQVLRVNSGATAPEWATTADQTPLTTKGDLFGFDTADARIPVGTNGHILTADSTQALGLKWAAPAGGGANWSLLNAGGTALTGATTITVTGISNAESVMVLVQDASSANADSEIRVRMNTNTGSVYYQAGVNLVANTTYSSAFLDNYGFTLTGILLGYMSSNAASLVCGSVTFTGCNSAGVKQFISSGTGKASGGNSHNGFIGQGYANISATTASISINSSTGNFDGGTVFIYTTA